MFNPVKNPKHYVGDGKISCMDALKSMLHVVDGKDVKLSPMVIYWWSCAFKYLWRWPMKNMKQDIDKCRQCLDYLEDELEVNIDGN